MSLTRRFLDALRRYRHARLLNQLAEEVAGDCRTAVWQRVAGKIVAMSPAEAGGYARARAGDCLDVAVDAALRRHRLHPAVRRQLAELATRRLVALLLEGLPVRGTRRKAA